MSVVAGNIKLEIPAPFVFADSAVAQVADLIAQEGNPNLKLRVFIEGGCGSSFSV
jgi:iron-sulfur cluster insertion protein